MKQIAEFTSAQKADIRRFCGYTIHGSAHENRNSWRAFQSNLTLDHRLNHLAPAEITITLQYLSTLVALERNLEPNSDGPHLNDVDEAADRATLFASWRRRLCGFLGVPTGPIIDELTNSKPADTKIELGP